MFGILFDGTWVFYALAAINLNFAVAVGMVVLWITRLICFALIVIEFWPRLSQSRATQ